MTRTTAAPKTPPVRAHAGASFPVKTDELTYELTVSLEEITPRLAASYLDLNFAGNRRRSASRARRYGNVMKRGHWRVTHEGIAFNADGKLIDGQHRLQAIVDSGETVTMFVVRGLPDEVYQALGRPMVRRIDAVATEEWIDSRVVAVGRVMLLGVRAGSGMEVAGLDEDALLTGIRQHQRALEFVMSRHHNKLITAPVLGAVARAYYSADPERLAQFLAVLQTNEPGDAKADHAALMLRRYITDDKHGANSYRARADLYRRTETAISWFLAGQRVPGKLHPAERERFPLPMEGE